MKIKMAKLSPLLISLFVMVVSVGSYASMAGLCNDPNHTQYICCPASGGWIVSSDCDSGASPYCINDTGYIANSNPLVTILQDCKNRGGTYVDYPFSKKIKNKKVN